MGHDHSTRMGATMPAWAIEGETPEEWPKRDAVPYVTMDEFHEKTGGRFAVPIGLRPAEVTPQVLYCGLEADRCARLDNASDDERVAAIYRAMAALAPVALVSDAEIALTRERDAAYAMRNETMAALSEMRDERDAWCRRYAERGTELDALHDRLAKFTVQNASEPEAPDPIANAIRDHGSDRRMVGR